MFFYLWKVDLRILGLQLDQHFSSSRYILTVTVQVVSISAIYSPLVATVCIPE